MLIKLFISFVVVGLGAYGGGLVTIPLIQYELVESRHWLAFDEMVRILAIAQMTPGPIAVNAATFTGFRLSGITGAMIATTSVILPSILILTFLVPCLEKIQTNGFLRRFGMGIQIGVLSLILFAVWSYGVVAVKGWVDFAVALGVFLLLAAFEGKVHPIIVIILCGVVGTIIF